MGMLLRRHESYTHGLQNLTRAADVGEGETIGAVAPEAPEAPVEEPKVAEKPKKRTRKAKAKQ